MVIGNCTNIDTDFIFTTDFMNQLQAPAEMLGKVYSLRYFLNNITRKECDSKVVVSIDRDSGGNEGTYTLLTKRETAPFLREQIATLVPLLQATHAFKKLRVGGSDGAYTRSPQRDGLRGGVPSSPYLKRLKTTTIYQNKPTRDDDSSMTSEDDSLRLNRPPDTTASRRSRKGATATIINYNDNHVIQSYRDVLTANGNSLMINPNPQGTRFNNTAPQISGFNGASNANATETQPGGGILRGTNRYGYPNSGDLEYSNPNRGAMTQQQQVEAILDSQQFKAALAQAVAPQVTELIRPTVEKISSIENKVGELHGFINTSEGWQRQQMENQGRLEAELGAIRGGMDKKMDSILELLQHTMTGNNNLAGTKRSSEELRQQTGGSSEAGAQNHTMEFAYEPQPLQQNPMSSSTHHNQTLANKEQQAVVSDSVGGAKK